MFVFFSSPSHFLSCCCGFSTSLYFSQKKSKNKDKNKWRNQDTMFKGSRINCMNELKWNLRSLPQSIEIPVWGHPLVTASQSFTTASGHWEVDEEKVGVKMLWLPSFDCVCSRWESGAEQDSWRFWVAVQFPLLGLCGHYLVLFCSHSVQFTKLYVNCVFLKVYKLKVYLKLIV